MDEITLLTEISTKMTAISAACDSLGSAVGFVSGLVVALLVATTWKG